DVFAFFFQAEDGIRDKLVTGVQTCALPISQRRRWILGDNLEHGPQVAIAEIMTHAVQTIEVGKDLLRPADIAGSAFDLDRIRPRSEERRVGKEYRRREAGGA